MCVEDSKSITTKMQNEQLLSPDGNVHLSTCSPGGQAELHKIQLQFHDITAHETIVDY